MTPKRPYLYENKFRRGYANEFLINRSIFSINTVKIILALMDMYLLMIYL